MALEGLNWTHYYVLARLDQPRSVCYAPSVDSKKSDIIDFDFVIALPAHGYQRPRCLCFSAAAPASLSNDGAFTRTLRVLRAYRGNVQFRF